MAKRYYVVQRSVASSARRAPVKVRSVHSSRSRAMAARSLRPGGVIAGGLDRKVVSEAKLKKMTAKVGHRTAKKGLRVGKGVSASQAKRFGKGGGTHRDSKGRFA